MSYLTLSTELRAGGVGGRCGWVPLLIGGRCGGGRCCRGPEWPASLFKFRVHVIGGNDTLPTSGLLLLWGLFRGLLDGWCLRGVGVGRLFILISKIIYHCPCVYVLKLHHSSEVLQLASAHEACLPCKTLELGLNGLGNHTAWGKRMIKKMSCCYSSFTGVCSHGSSYMCNEWVGVIQYTPTDTKLKFNIPNDGNTHQSLIIHSNWYRHQHTKSPTKLKSVQQHTSWHQHIQIRFRSRYSDSDSLLYQ